MNSEHHDAGKAAKRVPMSALYQQLDDHFSEAATPYDVDVELGRLGSWMDGEDPDTPQSSQLFVSKLHRSARKCLSWHRTITSALLTAGIFISFLTVHQFPPMILLVSTSAAMLVAAAADVQATMESRRLKEIAEIAEVAQRVLLRDPGNRYGPLSRELEADAPPAEYVNFTYSQILSAIDRANAPHGPENEKHSTSGHAIDHSRQKNSAH
ncbi:hypothetical protein [Actinoallomurus iriomotensis]|uniref:Uncharacterized protein n=1 Tax=Actinoallomurus iriomotensis TaxID=478107 RepID=A0A9W6SCL5_9ACTN|nr:hypothetical protein [Actinoallomurus iriomotensis]GLY91414.1 hypothetical protein Airi02_093430 [Actinoallomurus iriomotensis]